MELIKNNTHIKGAKIANETTDENGNTIDGGNLTLATNTLSYENIYDEDKAMSIGMGMSVGDTYGTEGVEQKSGSVDYSMHDKEQTNNATIGIGSIIVGGEELGSLDNGENSEGAGGFVANDTSLAGLNRDISQSQVITKDLSVNPIHVEYTDYAPKVDEEGNEMTYVESLKDGIMDWVDPRDERMELWIG